MADPKNISSNYLMKCKVGSRIEIFIERNGVMKKYSFVGSKQNVLLRPDDTDSIEEARREAALDEALRCTFPASDPVALAAVFISPSSINP